MKYSPKGVWTTLEEAGPVSQQGLSPSVLSSLEAGQEKLPGALLGHDNK